METFDWGAYVQTFTLGAFPWISQLKKLDIHFKSKGFDAHGIYNFFASIFSMSIFIYMSESLPYEIINFPSWWIFIISAFVLCLIYIFIYIYYKNDVNSDKMKWPIFVNFVSYVLLFCTLTTGFGLLKVHYGYYYFKGRVVNEKEEPISSAFLEVRGNSNEVINEFYSDDKGVFNILIAKDDFEKCRSFIILKENYHEEKGYISKAAFNDQIEKIILNEFEE
ncbi:hypothetical protein C900_05529 [Fulvivirga imtechensis AK7]|uniref:Uncharacterized protein n=1 Tax=Fulvivirga imtechensis AK7 TaxID=1237149 RepID=L8JND3_9BACT|nr:hypothetical protein [Fulvivirga imtechensis]ELR69044.1 hypothetical protein C900_05529 [Fulvivirga imtechensis AK7]